VLPWNGMLMLVQRLLLGLVIIGLINLSLLMKVLLIIKQHTGDMLGL
jgi:hypothetical protein